MKFGKNNLLLYAVTDRSWTENTTLEKQVEETLKSGATFIQLREKNIEISEFINLGKKIKNLTDKYNVPFIINDNVEVAIILKADGVHVGQKDIDLIECRNKIGENKIIGVSVQTVEQAMFAEKNGASYLGVGAIFSTNTKKDADNVSIDTLKKICLSVHIPVVAIGGINKENIDLLKDSGISGVAIISDIFGSKDIKKSTEILLKKSKEFF